MAEDLSPVASQSMATHAGRHDASRDERYKRVEGIIGASDLIELSEGAQIIFIRGWRVGSAAATELVAAPPRRARMVGRYRSVGEGHIHPGSLVSIRIASAG
jgi:hypothetical protein